MICFLTQTVRSHVTVGIWSKMCLPRFYPILDTELCARRSLDIVSAAEAILDSGGSMVQLRHKTHFSRDLFAQAQKIASLCSDASACFIVNDRADIAMLLDAGLHVGQDDLPPAAARRLIGPSRVLGFSTHNQQQLEAALREPVDYLAFGPIFATRSKLNPDPVVGLDELRRLRALTGKPLVAIGGITLANARRVIDAGADSVAVISDLIAENATPGSLRARTREWIAALELPR